MAAVPPGQPKPPATISGIFRTTFVEGLIDQILRDGSHDALHSLAGIGQGALGPEPMNRLITAMTAVVIARAQRIYIANHYPNSAAMFAGPGIPVARPAPVSAAFDDICNLGCVQCFHFLVRNNIISTNGYTNALEGYLFRASQNVPDSRPLMRYIAATIPLADFRAPQGVTDPNLTTFAVGLMEEPSMWVILRRIAALPPAAPLAAPDFGTWIQDRHIIRMGRWINVPAADALLTINIHVGRALAAAETIWVNIITSQNPHRGSMLQWLDGHPAPIKAFNPTGSFVNTPSSAPGLNPPGLNPPLIGHWPPWGIAMAMGDRRSATILSRMATINPKATVTGLLAPGICNQLGYAAVYFLEEDNIPMLKHWLSHASLTKNETLNLLESILVRLCDVRLEIDAIVMPPGYTGTIYGWTQEKLRQKKQKKLIAIRMIKVILQKGFRRFTATNILDRRTPTLVQEMMEDKAYQAFLVKVRRGQVQGSYREIADVILQLDAQPRNTRSGRQLQSDD